jgi:tRNA G10  N-methylase Trm11
VLRLAAQTPRADRPAEFSDDLCFTPELVAAFVSACTTPGQLVLDPFAGFGTTVHTAAAMGRQALGLEIDPVRVAYARSRLSEPECMRQADVRHLDWASVSPFTLAIGSPPYMTRHGHDQNPLSGHRTLDGNYDQYLRDLQQIYRNLARRSSGPEAWIVVNVANLTTTKLAWDVGSALAEVLTFEREVVLDWDRPQDWFTQDYCLIFHP